ncbi:hypothetical protein QP162_04710 [Sphingomonas aurantiaca]|uniref:hypothetical protein n=1 Tax=Sphingomonas aurantiaca TaxID=185949 RepID=UPI002FE1E6AB
MTVVRDLGDQVETAFKAETSAWQVDPDIVERLKRASIDRVTKSFAIDLETASEQAKTEAELRMLRTMFVAYGRMCVEATNDPIFSRLITAPAGFDPQTAATAFADSMLEDGGLASLADTGNPGTWRHDAVGRHLPKAHRKGPFRCAGCRVQPIGRRSNARILSKVVRYWAQRY